MGGNHEAANHLWELYYGGWAAPNMYYLGHAGVVQFGGLRIAGLSGIYNAGHYSSGHYESPPYDRSTVRSAYHVRDLEVYRLLKVSFCSLPAGAPDHNPAGRATGSCRCSQWIRSCQIFGCYFSAVRRSTVTRTQSRSHVPLPISRTLPIASSRRATASCRHPDFSSLTDISNRCICSSSRNTSS